MDQLFLDSANTWKSFWVHYYILMNVHDQMKGKGECSECMSLPIYGDYCMECYFSLENKFFNVREKVFA